LKLKVEWNWVQIDSWIIEQKKTRTRVDIEDELMKMYRWSESQVFSATDLYYNDKKYVKRVNKKR
jgi:hypothetical protein